MSIKYQTFKRDTHQRLIFLNADLATSHYLLNKIELINPKNVGSQMNSTKINM